MKISIFLSICISETINLSYDEFFTVVKMHIFAKNQRIKMSCYQAYFFRLKGKIIYIVNYSILNINMCLSNIKLLLFHGTLINMSSLCGKQLYHLPLFLEYALPYVCACVCESLILGVFLNPFLSLFLSLCDPRAKNSHLAIGPDSPWYWPVSGPRAGVTGNCSHSGLLHRFVR